jgi:hypothetical protein
VLFIIGVNVFFFRKVNVGYSGVLCVSLDLSSDNKRVSRRCNSEQNLESANLLISEIR